jgi:cysteine desulfurase
MPSTEEIYLDHAATTPMHPEVLTAMLPYFTEVYGNPSSVHRFGRAAKQALTDARDRLADMLDCTPGELVFTSGGTESDNMALFGAAEAQSSAAKPKRHIVVSSIEHHAVLHAAEELERRGYRVTYLSVDSTGRVLIDDVREAVGEDTALISVMYGNNEVGTLQPIEEIGRIARDRGALFHVDAVQALGALNISLSKLPVDLMSFSAHKINGPKGIGALYVNKKVKISPRLFGGSQERKRRAGTENVAGAVGFAKALSIRLTDLEGERATLARLRSAMIEGLASQLPPDRFAINGHPTEHLPHILNVSFPGTNTESMLMNMDLEGIAASSGSACSAGALEPSHVLQAMQLSDKLLRSAIRFSFGLGNCLNSVTISAQKVATIAKRFT